MAIRQHLTFLLLKAHSQMKFKMRTLISGIGLTFGLLAIAVADEASPKPSPKPSVSVEFSGRIRHGMIAIGGETTGTTISFQRIIWEVQLDNDAERTFAEDHNKETVVVTGSLRKVAGIERKDRWIIDVTKLSEFDETKDEEGIKMTIVGKLRASDPEDQNAGLMTIESAGQVWPIDLTSDAALKTIAESHVGHAVLLKGSLKPAPEEEPDSSPAIHVTSLNRPPGEPIQELRK